MHDVAERLTEIETRLAGLLAAGWRRAASEADALNGEADALVELGMGELAARLRAVAAATSPTDALRAATLAAAACRLLRARQARNEP